MTPPNSTGNPRPAPPSVRLVVVNWALLLAGLAAVGGGIWRLYQGDAVLAGTGMGGGLVLLLAATFERFESLKGLGLEAKTRSLDEKIGQAESILKQMKSLTELSGGALVELYSRIGRWDGAPTAREAYEMSRRVKAILESVGAEKLLVDAALEPWALATVRTLSTGVLAPYYEACAQQSPGLSGEVIHARSVHARQLLSAPSSWPLHEFSDRLRQALVAMPNIAPPEALTALRVGVEAWAPEIAHIARHFDFSDAVRCIARLDAIDARQPGQAID